MNLIDPTGQFGLLFAFVAATVVAGVANAVSTAINGGNAKDCLVSGLIGAGSAAIGFVVAASTGFSPIGNVAARAVSSAICDLGTTYYRTGVITAEDVAKTAVDVTIDACFSTVTYYYTDPIMDMGKQTLINSLVDGAVDIGESYLFGEQERISNDSVVNRTSCSGMSDFTIMRGRRNCVIYDV